MDTPASFGAANCACDTLGIRNAARPSTRIIIFFIFSPHSSFENAESISDFERGCHPSCGESRAQIASEAIQRAWDNCIDSSNRLVIYSVLWNALAPSARRARLRPVWAGTRANKWRHPDEKMSHRSCRAEVLQPG